MPELGPLTVSESVAATVPDWPELVESLRHNGLPRAVDVLRAARLLGRPVVQPRCGVGGHEEMRALLTGLAEAGPGLLTITIDSYTRLGSFDRAAEVLHRAPADLNGYPLVAHGWERGRELAEAVGVPVQIRHGSPDARDLFAVSLAAGITSFEGGGIGYNLPYAKDVPLERSLHAWQEVDEACGALARAGVVVDRELFGTLTAVLVPPAISLAVTVLEGCAAAAAGVTCLSVAYPQGGEPHQDIAALRAIPVLARRYLPASVEVHPVLHEFMGVFPAQRADADALILLGGLVGRLGGADKIINKTHAEAFGIPGVEANAHGIQLAALGASGLLDFVEIDESRVAEELDWIVREVTELVDPVLADADRVGLPAAIAAAFADGRMDIPFSASRYARSAVVPRRDRDGAIRVHDAGRLPFSPETKRRNASALGPVDDGVPAIAADIDYVAARFTAALPTRSTG